MKRIIASCVTAVAIASMAFAATAGASDVAVSHGPGTSWPSATGTPDGTTSGCGPVTLTSADDANGYGAFTFDIPSGTTFGELLLSGQLFGDWSLLSGTQAWAEPYLIVRFTDGTEAFVYSVEVNGSGTGTYFSDDSSHNTYHDALYALISYGTKEVSSVTLAVDNGDLSIEVDGVTSDSCAGAGINVREDHGYLCYAVGGTPYVAQTEAGDQDAVLQAEGYWLPTSVDGTLQCDAPIVGETTGPFADEGQSYVDNNGDVLGFSAAKDTGFEGVYLKG